MKNIFFLVLIVLMQACDSGDRAGLRSPSSDANDVSKDKAPAPPTSVQAQGVDPLYQHSWHLENTGQRAFATNSGLVGRDINVKDVYQNNIFGRNVKVAVSDNGVEISHPDLWFNHLSGESRDYTGAPLTWLNDPYPIGSGESDAHGTSVAGIISATRANSIGSHGVAPESSFAGFLFVGAAYSEAKYIDQAQGNFDIFNYSYGRVTCRFTLLPDSYIAQLKYGVEAQRGGLGSLYVKAAGNEYVGPRSDCLSGSTHMYFGNANLEQDQSTPYVISVASLSARGESASYSSPGSSLWISAPGGEFGDFAPAIIATDLQGCSRGLSREDNETNSFESGEHPLNPNCDYTSTMNGTSSAAPVLSGVIALILAQNPMLSWREVKHILAATAKKVQPLAGSTSHPYQGEYDLPGHVYQYGWLTNAAGYHFHNWYGFGGVDAKKAVEAAANYQSLFGSFIERKISSASNLNLTVPDRSATGVEDTLMMNEALFIEAVQLRVNIDHGYASDIGIEIESPSGMKSRLLNINSGIVEANLIDSLMLTNAFYGESTQGEWTIRVWDGAEQDEGVLKNWNLTFYGHKGALAHDSSTVTTNSAGTGNLGSAILTTSTAVAMWPSVTKAATSDDQKKPISRASRSPGLPSSKARGSVTKINNFDSSAPLSEILMWDELGKEKVLDVYAAEDKVSVISAKTEKYTLSIFKDEQLEAQKFFEAEGHEYKTGVYFQSHHYLVFIDKKGRSVLWRVNSLGERKIIQNPLQINQSQANFHLHVESDSLIFIVEDQDFFHAALIEKAGEMKNLSPRAKIDQKIIGLGLSEKNNFQVLLTQDLFVEKLELIQSKEWKSIENTSYPVKLNKAFVLPLSKSWVGLAAGEGIEEKLETSDFYFRNPMGESKVIRSAGDEKLVSAVETKNGEVVLFGQTNGSFQQSNFGEWDLVMLKLDEKGNEISRFQWGREQKAIDSTAQQKVHFVSLEQEIEGNLVKVWFSDNDELRMLKFYLEDQSSSLKVGE